MAATEVDATTHRSELGFSAEQLRVTIDRAAIAKVVIEKLKDGIRKVDIAPNINRFRLQQAESLLVEVLHCSAIQEYKDKLKCILIQEMAIFNMAEQTFFHELVETITDYLNLQEQYISKLLILFGYESVDAFFEAIAALPKVARANVASVVEVMKANQSSIISFLEPKLKDTERFLEIARSAMNANGSLLTTLFAFARKFDNMAQYYSQSLRPDDERKKAVFIREEWDQVHRNTLSSLMLKIATGRVCIFENIAISITDKSDDVEAIDLAVDTPHYIEDIRLAVEETALFMNEMMKSNLSLAAEPSRYRSDFSINVIWADTDAQCLRDEAFLDAFDLFIRSFPTESSVITLCASDGSTQNLALNDIMAHLVRISLVHKNLSTQQLAGSIVLCAQSMLGNKYQRPNAKMEKVAADLYKEICESSNILPEQLGVNLFNQALTSLSSQQVSQNLNSQGIFRYSSPQKTRGEPPASNRRLSF